MTIKVHALHVTNNLFLNYCYLVTDSDTDSAILIDPAWEQAKIEEKLAACNVTLSAILLTHHHLDHVHLASPLAEKYQVPVYMSRVEIDFYEYQCTNLIAIEDFKTFNSAGIIINPIFTPGHTKGSTSYLIGNNLFCGDTLFIEGCGLCEGKGADAGTMFDSLQLLKNRIAPETYIYPGHSYGKPVGRPFADLLINNIYLNFNNKEAFVAFRMRPHQRNLFDFK